MLSSIYIKGLAVIDELHIDFSRHLNVITGETGAGKSILIKALSLVLGGKGSHDVIRRGSNHAIVSAIFLLNEDHPVYRTLEEHGLGSIDSDDELILRRQVSLKGRSQAWINDIPVTLGVLRSVGSNLIDIFGQHDNHKLLDSSQHSYYLDQFIPKGSLVSNYKKLHGEVQESLASLRRDLKSYEEKLRDKDYLEFRKSELDALAPSLADYDEQRSIIENSKGALSKHRSLAAIEEIIDHGYSGKTLSQAFTQIISCLEDFPEDSYLVEKAHNLEEDLNQYSFELGKEFSKTDVNQVEISQVEARIDTYHQMFQKMNVKNIQSLCNTYSSLSGDLKSLSEFSDKIETRLTDISAQVSKLESFGTKLSRAREKAFKKIQKQIQGELTQLNMKGASLFLQLNPVEQSFSDLAWNCLSEEQSVKWVGILDSWARCGADGIEKVQFLLRSNPGDEPKPLSKIASGGEISRIMLGIKKVLSEGAQTCVMVFDEIDTGISGETATIVGHKLADIAQRFQVICISHLPQVAVFGHSHFKVSKSIVSGRAESKILRMSRKQCIEEVARLLSSGKITPTSIRNARELYEEAVKVL